MVIKLELRKLINEVERLFELNMSSSYYDELKSAIRQICRDFEAPEDWYERIPDYAKEGILEMAEKNETYRKIIEEVLWTFLEADMLGSLFLYLEIRIAFDLLYIISFAFKERLIEK